MADIVEQAIYNKSRLDKFILSFTTPECLRSSSSKAERLTDHKSYLKVIPDKLQFSVFGVLVPSVNIPAVDLPYSGQTMKASSHTRQAYSDVTVNYTIDNQFNNYWYIWRWLDILNSARFAEYDRHVQGMSQNIVTQPGANAENTKPPKLMLDYTTDMTLYGINEYNKETISFTYKYAFPTALGEITYNYRTPGEVETSFTFAFTQLLVNLV